MLVIQPPKEELKYLCDELQGIGFMVTGGQRHIEHGLNLALEELHVVVINANFGTYSVKALSRWDCEKDQAVRRLNTALEIKAFVMELESEQ